MAALYLGHLGSPVSYSRVLLDPKEHVAARGVLARMGLYQVEDCVTQFTLGAVTRDSIKTHSTDFNL